MSQAADVRGNAAQKLSFACMLAAAGLALASDAAYEVESRPSIASYEHTAHRSSSSVGEVMQLVITLQHEIDAVYERLCSGKVPAEALQHHPFGTITDILDRALAGLKPLKGSGELGPDGDRFIIAVAQARRKADRNANLIRQMTAEPKVFTSNIDRAGLAALARHSREVAANFTG